MDLTIFTQLLISGILLGGIYALSSIGLTLIFGVMKIVNFAHGEYLMLAMYATFWLFTLTGIDPYLSIFVVGPIMFALGWVSYRFLVRHTIGKSLFWSADFRTISLEYARSPIIIGPFPTLGIEELIINPARLIAFVLGMGLALIFYLFIKKSYTGKVIRATSQDRSTALLMGINIDRVFMLTFAIGLLMVGVAGALMMPIFTAHPCVGFEFVLIMFVVVVLGGMGSIAGAVIAGLFIGVLEVFSSFLISPESKQAIYFLVFIAVLVVKPSGLFGVKGEEELERIEAID